MCFGSKSAPAPQPQKPAQVLQQATPAKKAINKNASSDLSIGTKKYRTDPKPVTGTNRYRTGSVGIGASHASSTNSPVIPSVSK